MSLHTYVDETCNVKSSAATYTKKVDAVWQRVLMRTVSSGHFPPRPKIELERRKRVLLLRQKFSEMISTIGPLAKPPREAFNRWLIDRANVGDDGDPLLGHWQDAEPTVPEGLCDEVMAALPLLLPFADPGDSEAQVAQLKQYAEAIQTHLGSSITQALSKACVEALTWQPRNSVDSITAAVKLKEMRSVGTVAIAAYSGSLVRKMGRDLEKAAGEAAAAIQQLGREVIGVDDVPVSVTLDAQRGVYVLTASAQGVTPQEVSGGETESEGIEDHSLLDKVAFCVSIERLDLLARALRHSARRAAHLTQSGEIAEDSVVHKLASPDALWDFTFCVLCRYDALCGPGPAEGRGLQSAVPPGIFRALADRCGGAGIECFASPLNCVYDGWHFCSLFGDLDVVFGSLGSFFESEFRPEILGGIFELNPPFTSRIAELAVDKVLDALTQATVIGTPLVVAAFLPEGLPDCSNNSSGTMSSLRRLLESPFAQATTLPVRRSFVHGLAHRIKPGGTSDSVLSRARCILLRSDVQKTLGAPIVRQVHVAWQKHAGHNQLNRCDDGSVLGLGAEATVVAHDSRAYSRDRSRSRSRNRSRSRSRSRSGSRSWRRSWSRSRRQSRSRSSGSTNSSKS